MARNNPMRIQVTDNNEVIGHMSTEQFMAYMDRPRRFLSDLVKDFNEMKEANGEQERVKVVLNG